MTPLLTEPQARTEFRTRAHHFIHFDAVNGNDWSVDQIVKRTLAVTALLILMVGAFPLVTAVHGQPKSDIEYEVQHINERLKELKDVPLEIQLILDHQKSEDKRADQLEGFESYMVKGFIATVGAIALAMFVWALSQFGVTFGKKK